MIARSIWRARFAWISWPATARRSDCATVAVRIGRSPRSLGIVSRSSGSLREAPQELGVVVVEAECEANVVDAGLALRVDDHGAVRPLRRGDELDALLDADGGAVGPVGDDPAGVACKSSRDAQRIRPTGAQLGSDHRADSRDRLSRC